jgi:mono/diheme cytochrome c family protein
MPRFHRLIIALILSTSVLTLWGLSANAQRKGHARGAPEEEPRPAEIVPDAKEGRKAYRRAHWTTTGLTCIHCHADFNEKKDPLDTKIRPAHPLYNSAHRAIWRDYRGENILDLKLAMKVCIDTWIVKPDTAAMRADSIRADSLRKVEEKLRRQRRGKKPVELPPPDTTAFKPAWDYTRIAADIASYLEEISPEAQSKPVEVVRTETIPSDPALQQGNLARGKVIYERSCSICHASGPAPSLYRNGYTPRQIARKVRGLSPEGIAGVIMPAFSLDRLSNLDLVDVVAYVVRM